MNLDRQHQYVRRVGSDNQYRLFWNGEMWCYEFLAGGVIFDEQRFKTEAELIEGIASHGLKPDQFSIDETEDAQRYSDDIQSKRKQLLDAGIQPCAKHGLMAKNLDNTCEACQNLDYPDDFKGTEG